MTDEDKKALLNSLSTAIAECERLEAEVIALQFENKMLRGELAEKP